MTTQIHKKYDYMSKLVIVGDSAVGKTNILLRLTQDNYRMLHNSTIGVDFKIKTIEVEGKRIKFTLWDTAGQDRFKTITSNYYRGADGVIFTYSVSDKNSFNNMESWINNVEENTDRKICKMIVANKCDLLDRERQVSKEQGLELAKRLKVPFFQVSAKEDVNIREMFLQMGKMIKTKIQQQKLALANSVSINKNKLQNTKKKNCC